MLVMGPSALAEEHGFICLLHEKPFAGLNGLESIITGL